MIKRDINLRDFRLELKHSDGYIQRQSISGELLIEFTKGGRGYGMEIVEYYAARGKLTDLDAMDSIRSGNGHKALTYATYKEHLGIVKALLVRGMDENGTNCDYNTSLLCAAEYGHVKCLKLLLKAGADEDKANKDGYTSLIRAAERVRADCLEILSQQEQRRKRPTTMAALP